MVLVGNNPASEICVRNKSARAKSGIRSVAFDLPASTTQAELRWPLLTRSTPTRKSTAFWLQLPLPAAYDADAVIERIDPKKDVDSFQFATTSAAWR